MLLTIARWLTFLVFCAVTAFYMVQTGGHPAGVMEARDRITLAAVLWVLTLVRKNRRAAGTGLHGTATWASAGKSNAARAALSQRRPATGLSTLRLHRRFSQNGLFRRRGNGPDRGSCFPIIPRPIHRRGVVVCGDRGR